MLHIPAQKFVSRIYNTICFVQTHTVYYYILTMTGIADIYIMLSQPQSKEARLRFWSFFQSTKKPEDLDRFVLLSWKRSGSNLLSGILHLHPEIIMHN